MLGVCWLLKEGLCRGAREGLKRSVLFDLWVGGCGRAKAAARGAPDAGSEEAANLL